MKNNNTLQPIKLDTNCVAIDLCRSPWKLLSITLSSTRKATKFPRVKLTQQLKLRRYEYYIKCHPKYCFTAGVVRGADKAKDCVWSRNET